MLKLKMQIHFASHNPFADFFSNGIKVQFLWQSFIENISFPLAADDFPQLILSLMAWHSLIFLLFLPH